MLMIHDDRDQSNLIALKNIQPNGFFIWREEFVLRRICVSEDVKIQYDEPDGIPAMLMSTGDLVTVDRDTMVEPIKAELHIVED